MTGTLRLGVLGAAAIAWRRTLPSLPSGLRLAAVGSRDPARAARFTDRFGGVPVAGPAAVLDRDDVDAVYVPLPTALHAEWAAAALRAGKHVLVEKPLATTAADAAELVGLARARGLLLMENFAFLHHRTDRAVTDLLDAGTIGELRAVTAEFAFPPLPDGDIRHRPELGGGALLDAGVYPVRLALRHLGAGTEVCGAALHVEPELGVDVAGAALLAGPTGITAHVAFGFRHAYRCGYVLWGSAGRIAVERAFTAPDDHAPTVRVETTDDVQERTLPADAQFRNLLAAFAAAIAGETPSARCAREATIVDQATLVERIAVTAHRR